MYSSPLVARSGRSSTHFSGWASARSRRAGLALFAAALLSAAAPVAQAFNPDTIAPSSISLQGVNYYSAPVFADAMKMAREWQTTIGGVNTTLKPDSGKLNAVGLPAASSATEVFTTFFNANSGEKPLTLGRYVVSWTGVGDVTLTGGGVTLLGTTGAGATNGGRRVYSCPTGRPTIRVTGLTSSGLSSLNVWLPHPDDTANTSLEPAERTAYNTANNIAETPEAFYFSPVLIRVLKDRPWSAIRFMDWMATNDQPAGDWSERRPPSYATQANGWLSRNAVTGVTPEYDNDGNKVWHSGGVAWEYAVALCNATGKNLWINVPHRAVLSLGTADDYVANLAKVIAYGSDATGTPYSSTYSGTKVWQPLASNLEVFVEYSNEVWNGQFDQRAFTENQSTATSVPQQVAINCLNIWNAFEAAAPALKSGSVDRVVRLLGCQQVSSTNLKNSLTELYTAGKDGQVGYADAVTTASYFGNAIETYVRDAILEGTRPPNAGTKDDTLPGGAVPQYVYTPEAQARLTDAYFNKAFDEWTRRVLYGDTTAGNAFDTTGRMGGIEAGVYTEAAARGLKVVATEGGASIYTDKFDNGSPDDDLLTNFVAKFPTNPRMADLMKLHLEFGRMRGLRSYNMFTLTGDAAKYGQWGNLNLLGTQETAPEATKYRAVRAWFDEFSTIRPAGAGSAPLGTAPSFTTAEDLGEFRVGTALNLPIATSNATSLTVVGKIFVSGSPALAVTVNGTSATITGTPNKPGLNYVLLRAMDNDKDPVWRTFKFNVKHWSQNNYFNDLATTTSPIASFVYNSRYVFSTEDGNAGFLIDPLASGSTNKAIRMTSAAPLNVEYNSGTDPLNNQPFNFDTVKLGRGDTAVIGARVEGLSEAGNVIVAEDIALSGGINTVAEFIRDANWDNLFSVKITFYSARVYNGTTKVYDITPVAGGIVDDLKVNL